MYRTRVATERTFPKSSAARIQGISVGLVVNNGDCLYAPDGVRERLSWPILNRFLEKNYRRRI